MSEERLPLVPFARQAAPQKGTACRARIEHPRPAEGGACLHGGLGSFERGLKLPLDAPMTR